jgi:hypothetical protein
VPWLKGFEMSIFDAVALGMAYFRFENAKMTAG